MCNAKFSQPQMFWGVEAKDVDRRERVVSGGGERSGGEGVGSRFWRVEVLMCVRFLKRGGCVTVLRVAFWRDVYRFDSLLLLIRPWDLKSL